MSAAWITVVAVLWAFVIVLGSVVIGILRRIAPILERAEARGAETPSMTGLPIGSPVPVFAAQEVDGRAFTEAELGGSRTLVLFLGSSCQACDRFVFDLEAGATPDLSDTKLVVVSDADDAGAIAESAEVTVVLDVARSVADAFESNLVPQAFVVEDGKVAASGRPNDWDGLRNLLNDAKGGESRLDVAAAL